MRIDRRSFLTTSLGVGTFDAARDCSSEAFFQRIDSALGKLMIAKRFATVEPVFANLRHNKGLKRFTLRGTTKVDGQWKLYALMHNIEKLAGNGYAV